MNKSNILLKNYIEKLNVLANTLFNYFCHELNLYQNRLIVSKGIAESKPLRIKTVSLKSIRIIGIDEKV